MPRKSWQYQCQCGKKFPTYSAEAFHRHNFPALCRTAKPKIKRVTVTLTEAELWELRNIFGAGFESGGEGNEIADRVSNKLSNAMDRLK